MNASSYLLDANVFIEAARRYYAFDIAPRFWDSLCEHAGTGRVLSIDRVKDELGRGNDELSEWITSHFDDAFASTDNQDIINIYREIVIWIQNQDQFLDAAKAEFARNADGWLVAFAKVNDCILVTHEVLAIDARKKIPIPNICQAFEVPWTDTFSMLRNIGVRFL
ncbi:MAG: DUF4411 family protein [Sedimentisphaerales bacterium]|nr:DUF4411 family protein [Sedimentisphaerales bacterium]